MVKIFPVRFSTTVIDVRMDAGNAQIFLEDFNLLIVGPIGLFRCGTGGRHCDLINY